MRILVTGGCGYIGSILVPKLLGLGHEVIAFDIQWFGNYLADQPNLTVVQGDIRDIDSVPMEGVNAIIHLANVANDPCGDLNSKLVWEVNALGTMQLLEKAIENGVEKFLLASSGSVYGIKDEDQVTEELSLVPISDYNKTKMISERVLLSYKDKIDIFSIRPATVCGYSPRMRLDVAVNLLTMQALTKGEITVLGGNQTRPNVHIQDITDIFIHFLGKGGEFAGIYNAGFENISIMDIAEMVKEQIGAEIIVKPSNDPRSYRLNSDKLLATGFSPKHSVLDGIKDVVAAYNDKKLFDEERYYNIKTMKTLDICKN
ncbi:NAD-dependent epimerase/dehydratase family protein [Pseudodesulfovibrio karagichevae]|uniref:NAD-dependent epimerase/dehydratase family protein n=1 Tax=Pseudodesulfovibrio karagichevae TaxID=3239305 RepID=A0ABV4K2C9_9BACT